MIDARNLVGTHDILFVTLDALRYDVAVETLAEGATPNLAHVLPNGIWEKRHTPGNFTYAAHHAFFAGFLPTPITPGPHERLFAARRLVLHPIEGFENAGVEHVGELPQIVAYRVGFTPEPL